MTRTDGALMSVMNTIVDAPSELGIRHIGMPTRRKPVASDPGGEERTGGVVGHASIDPGRVLIIGDVCFGPTPTAFVQPRQMSRWANT